MHTNSLYPHFSEAEYARRYAAMRAAMRERDISALVLYGTPSMYHEVLYLSNVPTTQEAMLIVPVEGDPVLLVQYFNHAQNARRVACIEDVRWGGPDSAASAASILRELGLAAATIGITGMMPLQRYTTLQRELPQATLVDFSLHFQQLRLVKSEEEIGFLRRGAELSDRAMEALEREARPGITEYELAAIVEGAYLGLGGKNHIHYMATTPMQQPTVCVPAQHQSARVLQKGDVLITEISAHYHGYAGQILRPFAIAAPPTPEYQRMYDVAVEAFQRLARVIRPGATSEDVLDAADSIHEAGYSINDDLVHGFGGGYLQPVLRTRRTSAAPAKPFTFRENMTIVIQPNIITADERMGLQVGELMRVTRDGIESLHHYPMRFVQCA